MKKNGVKYISFCIASCLLSNAFVINQTFAQTETNGVSTNSEVEKETEVIDVVAMRPQGIQISSKQITTMPGGFGDPLKALDALPGVVLALPSTGSPVAQPAIRGSSPGDNQYESDFLPVGYVFHREGISIFNPLLIKGFDLKTSAWSGQYNDSIGGVISTELRDPNFEEFNAIIDLSQIRSGILVESPLGSKAAFYASYRESLIHHFVDDVVEDEDFTFSTPPRNHDYQVKFVWDMNSKNTLRVVATGAEDIARIAFKEDAKEVARNPDLAAGEGFSSKYDNVGFILDNDSWLGESKFAVNFLDRQIDINEGLVEQSSFKTKDTLFKWRTKTALDIGHLTWGGEWLNRAITHTNNSRLLTCIPEFDTCAPSPLSPIVQDIVDVDVRFSSLYADWYMPVTQKWDATLTLAVNNDDFTDTTSLEPRVLASYQLNEKQTLSFSAGKYQQWFRDPNILSPVFGNPDLTPSDATMLGVVFDQAMGNGFNWKVDLYYKQLNNLIVPEQSDSQMAENGQVMTTSDVAPYSNNGEGTAWGAEFMINKALTDDWYGWFSLAYTKSERKNSQTNETINYEFDIPVIANLVAKYQWSDNWHFGVKWTYRSGRRYTDVLDSFPVFANADNPNTPSDEPLFYVPVYGEFNGQRRESGHRLDIRVDYMTKIYGSNVNMYIDVLNVLGSQRIQEDEWNADYTSSIPDYEFPDEMFPGLGISMQF
ncbi:TonB-dependent receptor plug domain-containing protein [Agaribacter marinus]|uniref:TonB-dependent receptor n=1 Tax=Agaribacter marinus TaxID=1431249 RepID=A0AA37SZB7_9ALTE|nr:outer membrane beta-barrel protein [Agaribacter marinus]GLR71369.1 TonB-dependent receptor [Agaribacter marinus]